MSDNRRMPEPPVTAVYRITLPVHDGQILPGELRGAPPYTFGIGATVVLEVGDGEWMSRDHIEELGVTLVGTERVSVTATGVPWGDLGATDEHAVRGVSKVALALEGAIRRALYRMVAKRRAEHERAA